MLAIEEAEEYLAEALEDIEPEKRKDRMSDLIDDLANTYTDLHDTNATRYDWLMAGDNYRFVERAIEECTWKGVGKSLMGAILTGQYLANREKLEEAAAQLDQLELEE